MVMKVGISKPFLKTLLRTTGGNLIQSSINAYIFPLKGVGMVMLYNRLIKVS